jgi:hypothetical protein
MLAFAKLSYGGGFLGHEHDSDEGGEGCQVVFQAKFQVILAI